jgi:hypothetical protein
MMLAYRVLDGVVGYVGTELRSGWVREKQGLAGDAAAGFIGPCDGAHRESSISTTMRARENSSARR